MSNISPTLFASKVLPTPGGPDNPIEYPLLDGFEIHFAICKINCSFALTCPYTLLLKLDSISLNNTDGSFSVILCLKKFVSSCDIHGNFNNVLTNNNCL